MPAARLDCGCRRRSVRKHGHRPACVLWDSDRHSGQEKVRAFRRKWEARTTTTRNARGVIL